MTVAPRLVYSDQFSGGYHHAHRDRAEGFCVYADVPIAIEKLRAEGSLSAEARSQWSARLADQRERFPHVISIRAQLDGEVYFSMLQRFLPAFLAQRPFALAFFNAGSEVLRGDPVGARQE